jgi:ribosomal protein S18 acetylase RimI-like enzyme
MLETSRLTGESRMSLDSMYAAYLKELEGFEIVQHEHGYMTYKLFPEHAYIRDVYVMPEFRQTGVGRDMMKQVVDEAKKCKLNKLVGSVVPSHNDSDYRMEVMRRSGFVLLQSQDDIIYFVKDI